MKDQILIMGMVKKIIFMEDTMAMPMDMDTMMIIKMKLHGLKKYLKESKLEVVVFSIL